MVKSGIQRKIAILLVFGLSHVWAQAYGLARRASLKDPNDPRFLEAVTAFMSCAKLLWDHDYPQIRSLDPAFVVTGGLNMWHLFPGEEARSIVVRFSFYLHRHFSPSSRRKLYNK